MGPAFLSTKLYHFPLYPKSKFKLRNNFKAQISKFWKKQTNEKPTHNFIERQNSAPSFVRKFRQQKKASMGNACPSRLFSQMHNTAQIWTDLESAILFAKTFFHSWPSKT